MLKFTWMAGTLLMGCACLVPLPASAQVGAGAPQAGAGAQAPQQQQQQQRPIDQERQMQTQADQQMDSGSQKMAKSPDAQFVMKAAQGGMAEVKLGQLAAQKATNPDVKAFGQQMVDDHSKANDELKTAAQKSGISIPTTLDSKDSALYSKLENASADKFDREYVKAMVKDHQQDVKEFQKESDKGTDPQIKEFAAKTTPILQSHLDKIKTISASVSGKK